MLSVPCQALLYFPTVNKDKQTDGHHQSGCKDKTFWLLLRLFNKDIPSIPQEYLCQKAPKRLSLDDLPNIPPRFHPTSSEMAKALRRLPLVCQMSQDFLAPILSQKTN